MGSVCFKSQSDATNMFFIWSERPGFERIDLLDDLSRVNVMDTSNTIASYIRDKKEMVYGEQEYINLMLRCKKIEALLSDVAPITTTTVEDGIVRIIRDKLSKDGMHHKIVMENGYVVEEVIETDIITLNTVRVSKDTNFDVVPFNIADYESILFDDYIEELDNGESDYFSIDYLKAKYKGKIEHIYENDFVVITSMEEANKRLNAWKNSTNMVKAIDLEGTGLNTGIYGEDVITGVVMSYSETESTYYPFRQEGCEYNLPLSYLKTILRVVNNQPKDVIVVAHNGIYEKKGIKKESKFYVENSSFAKEWAIKHNDKAGLDDTWLRIDADSFLLSVLLNPIMRKGLHDLKSKVERVTGRFYLTLNKIFKHKIKFNVLPPELIKLYACPDTSNTITIYKDMIKQLPRDEFFIFKLENDLVEAKAISEFYGLPSDHEKLLKLTQVEEEKVEMLANIFKKYHRITGNINSNDVKKDIIYDRLRCPVEVRTATNRPSTSVIAINHIVSCGKKDISDEETIPPDIVDSLGRVIVKGKDLASNKYPSLVILQAYNKSRKELGALRRLIKKSERNRITFNINQVGAGSGRQSSDAHQYSSQMKGFIISDSPDHWLIDADYKQIELRVLAYLAKQLNLIELEKDPNIDIHRAILSIIKGIPMWMITDKMRKEGKAVNFGVVYGITEYGLAIRANGPKYTKQDLLREAQAITDFYNGLSGVKQFVAANAEFVLEKGYIATAFGRRRLFPELLDKSLPDNEKSGKIRAANNTPVQGFAADLLKRVEVNITNYIREKGWDRIVKCSNGEWLPMVRLMLSIHDEVLVSAHKDIDYEEIIIMLKDCMEIKIKDAPPFFACPAFVPNWQIGHDVPAYEIPVGFRDEIIEEYKKRNRILNMDTYLEDLNEWRDRRLKDYMNTLVSKYVTVDEVAKHIQHDEFTHTLISIYIKDGEKMSHEEAIYTATQRYMESHGDTSHKHIANIVDEDKQERSEILSSWYDNMETFNRVDANGDIILEVYDEDEEEADSIDDINRINGFIDTPIDANCVLYLSNQVFIDLSSIEFAEDADKVNDLLTKYHDESSDYNVIYTRRGKIIPANIRIPYLTKLNDEITELLCLKKEVL